MIEKCAVLGAARMLRGGSGRASLHLFVVLGDGGRHEARAGNGGASSSNGWTKVATFMPDGSAKHDAEITIGHGSGSITLRLNGSTGAVSTAEGKQ